MGGGEVMTDRFHIPTHSDALRRLTQQVRSVTANHVEQVQGWLDEWVHHNVDQILIVRSNNSTGEILQVFMRGAGYTEWRMARPNNTGRWSTEMLIHRYLMDAVQVAGLNGTITCWVRKEVPVDDVEEPF